MTETNTQTLELPPPDLAGCEAQMPEAVVEENRHEQQNQNAESLLLETGSLPLSVTTTFHATDSGDFAQSTPPPEPGQNPVVQSVVENVVEELQRSLNESVVVKQEFDDNSKSQSPIAVRKSTRLRTRTKGSLKGTGKLVTEMQVSIDPDSISSRHNLCQDGADGEEEDDVFDDDEDDEEFVLDDDDDDDDEIVIGRKDDDDYDGNGNLELAEDDDDDDFDEYRPLKKRRLPRRKPTKRSNHHVLGLTTTTTTSKRRTTKSHAADVLRLQTILYKVRMHHSMLQQINQMLTKMNSALVDQLYVWATGDQKLAVPVDALLDSLREREGPAAAAITQSFVAAYGDMLQQYGNAVNDKQQLERTIDGQCQPEVVEKAVRKLCGKWKRKVPTLLELIGEAAPPSSGPKPAKKTPPVSEPNEGSEHDTKSNIAPVVKRKRNRKRKRDDGEKKHYLQCPWPNCTYGSKRNWALNEHINLTHTGLKQFGCKVESCPATFFGSAELDNHMKKFHAEVASKEFMPCTWPGCNALFKSKLGLRAHVQVHKGENLIPCDWPGCNYLAKNKRQHENHTRKHTGDRPFSCDYPDCEAKFRTNDSLRHHKKSHSEYRPFRCDWPGCEANFKTNRGLTIHRALHTGEKLFKCDWPDCDFASERKYHVDLHIFENHTHVKPYPCTWDGCDASFLRNDKLQNHLKIHRQEKPFKCIHPACDKHFVEKGNMMKHYNNVHKR